MRTTLAIRPDSGRAVAPLPDRAPVAREVRRGAVHAGVMAGTETERQLVLACVRGDAAAWDRFHARFWPVVARAAQRALGEGHDGARVDDVVGDVFALLLADERAVLARFEGRSSIATWLRVLTRRQVGRQLRRRAAGPLEEPGAVVANDPAPGEAATARELSRLVAEQLEGLAPRDRLALRLFYDGARSYEEVARALDLPVARIGTLLARARARLAKALGLRLGR